MAERTPVRHFDAIVVGGGPAGSTFAWAAGMAGMRVAVIDKQQFPRDKVCAGWVTPAVLETLALDVEDYANGRVLQPITAMRTACLGHAPVTTDYGEAVSYGIRRREFDAYLLGRARPERVINEPVKSIDRQGRGFVVNGSYTADVLVGAGGHFCPVSRWLGNKLGRTERVVAAQEIEFPSTDAGAASGEVRADTPELYFCPDLKGYGWVFRKQGVLNVGLGREDNHQLELHVRAFRDYLVRTGRIPADSPSRFKGHAYLLYDHGTRRIADDGVMLIGDAAGLAFTQSGEGIRTAVESAVAAAEVARGCDGDYSRERLSEFERGLQHRFGPRRPDSPAPGRLKSSLAGLLLRTRWFSRHIVLNRWFFHRQQAPLAAPKRAA